MCVHEGAQLGSVKLNRLQMELQRRAKVDTWLSDDNIGSNRRSKSSVSVESFLNYNKDRERRDGNHLDNEYNKRLSFFSTYTPEDANKGLDLADTFTCFEKFDHLIMDADARQVYFDERAVKNAAANIILYSPAVLQVTVTDMIQDDTKTFFSDPPGGIN